VPSPVALLVPTDSEVETLRLELRIGTSGAAECRGSTPQNYIPLDEPVAKIKRLFQRYRMVSLIRTLFQTNSNRRLGTVLIVFGLGTFEKQLVR